MDASRVKAQVRTGGAGTDRQFVDQGQAKRHCRLVLTISLLGDPVVIQVQGSYLLLRYEAYQTKRVRATGVVPDGNPELRLEWLNGTSKRLLHALQLEQDCLRLVLSATDFAEFRIQERHPSVLRMEFLVPPEITVDRWSIFQTKYPEAADQIRLLMPHLVK